MRILQNSSSSFFKTCFSEDLFEMHYSLKIAISKNMQYPTFSNSIRGDRGRIGTNEYSNITLHLLYSAYLCSPESRSNIGEGCIQPSLVSKNCLTVYQAGSIVNIKCFFIFCECDQLSIFRIPIHARYRGFHKKGTNGYLCPQG